jgi:hypothetical protein
MPNLISDLDDRRVAQLKYDLGSGLQGWRANAANFPEELAEQVSFSAKRAASPLGEEAIEIRGANPTASLLMYLSRTLGANEGIQPGKTYQIYARTRFVSGASAECVGAGGSPGAMTVSVGASSGKNSRYQDENGNWRLAYDPWNSPYLDAGLIDNGKACAAELNDYTQITRTSAQPMQVQADQNGNLSVTLGIHGGFSGETRLWIESIELAVTEL